MPSDFAMRMRQAAAAAVRLLAVLAVGLSLGACSKCDVPDFTHWGSPAPPHACNDSAPQQ